MTSLVLEFGCPILPLSGWVDSVSILIVDVRWSHDWIQLLKTVDNVLLFSNVGGFVHSFVFARPCVYTWMHWTSYAKHRGLCILPSCGFGTTGKHSKSDCCMEINSTISHGTLNYSYCNYIITIVVTNMITANYADSSELGKLNKFHWITSEKPILLDHEKWKTPVRKRSEYRKIDGLKQAYLFSVGFWSLSSSSSSWDVKVIVKAKSQAWMRSNTTICAHELTMLLQRTMRRLRFEQHAQPPEPPGKQQTVLRPNHIFKIIGTYLWFLPSFFASKSQNVTRGKFPEWNHSRPLIKSIKTRNP